MAQLQCPRCGNFVVGAREGGRGGAVQLLGIPLSVLGGMMTILGIALLTKDERALALAIPGIIFVVVGLPVARWQRQRAGARCRCDVCGHEWYVD